MAEKAGQALRRRHPLQRLDSPSPGASAALHILGLSSAAYSFAWLVNNPNPMSATPNDSYGWHLQYLTIIGLSLATLTFASGLLADLTLSRRLFQFKNALSLASAPLECLISVLYWGIRLIDPALLIPADMPMIPLPADLSFHAVPSLLLATDLLFLSPPATLAFLPALALSGAIAFAYWYWIELCFSHNGFYPYPLFAVLSTAQRIGLFAGSAAVMAGVTVGLGGAYGVVNGREVERRVAGVARYGEEKSGSGNGHAQGG